MGSDPALKRDVELQHPVPCRTMSGLIDKPEQEASTAIVCHGKAHGVAGTFLRKPRTAYGVAQIAKLAQFVLSGFSAFVAWSGTVSLPTAT